MGNRNTDKVHRQELRRKLEARGVDPDEVVRQVEELRAKQGRTVQPPAPKPKPKKRSYPPSRYVDPTAQRARGRAAWEARRAALEDETYARLALDDRGYKPASPDRLRTGTARVTGMAARVAARRSTITRYQYDEAEKRQAR